MSIAEIIETKLTAGLSVSHINIENESHMHSGPATESHFKLTLVSDDFSGKRPVQRHQVIYGLLAEQMQNPIHALALHLFTQEEWSARGETVMPSPQCLGGSKGDH